MLRHAIVVSTKYFQKLWLHNAAGAACLGLAVGHALVGNNALVSAAEPRFGVRITVPDGVGFAQRRVLEVRRVVCLELVVQGAPRAVARVGIRAARGKGLILSATAPDSGRREFVLKSLG